ncbi:MAG: AAA family ATPase, partial [Oscillospiraceae bacterium]|nr:AAA family ATPase [Oscillospiraceae bacterium]
MVLKRKIYNELLDWKNESNGATALLVKGARRVGKSYICRKFGEAEYGSMVFIDFSNADNTLKDFFYKDTYNLDIFFAKISAYHDVPLRERNTLFVFDEVQSFPRARQLIKHLVADGRYDYIETGSL